MRNGGGLFCFTQVNRGFDLRISRGGQIIQRLVQPLAGPHRVFAQLGKVLRSGVDALPKRFFHINGGLRKVHQAATRHAARGRHGRQCRCSLARGHPRCIVHRSSHAGQLVSGGARCIAGQQQRSTKLVGLFTAQLVPNSQHTHSGGRQRDRGNHAQKRRG